MPPSSPSPSHPPLPLPHSPRVSPVHASTSPETTRRELVDVRTLSCLLRLSKWAELPDWKREVRNTGLPYSLVSAGERQNPAAPRLFRQGQDPFWCQSLLRTATELSGNVRNGCVTWRFPANDVLFSCSRKCCPLHMKRSLCCCGSVNVIRHCFFPVSVSYSFSACGSSVVEIGTKSIHTWRRIIIKVSHRPKI